MMTFFSSRSLCSVLLLSSKLHQEEAWENILIDFSSRFTRKECARCVEKKKIIKKHAKMVRCWLHTHKTHLTRVRWIRWKEWHDGTHLPSPLWLLCEEVGEPIVVKQGTTFLRSESSSSRQQPTKQTQHEILYLGAFNQRYQKINK